VITDLPEAAMPDHLTDALRRHGVLSTGRVRDVTTDAPRDLLMSRIVRVKLAYDGPAEKAPATLILKISKPRDGRTTLRAREKCSSITLWRRRRRLAFCCVASMRCTRRRPKRGTCCWRMWPTAIATERPLPPTEPQCRMIVGTLARFHAAWWDATKGSVSVVAPPDPAMVRDIYQRIEGLWANLLDRLGDRLSADRRWIYERFLATPINPRLATRKNLSIVHGDPATFSPSSVPRQRVTR
jgi:hypothetical protein